MKRVNLVAAVSLTLAGLAANPNATAEESKQLAPAEVDNAKDTPTIEFTEAFLNDTENLSLGKKLFIKHCLSCHGKRARTGKPFQLRPQRKGYTADFVYGRVTDGYGKMASWQKKLSDHERMAVTAYILSDKFAY